MTTSQQGCQHATILLVAQAHATPPATLDGESSLVVENQLRCPGCEELGDVVGPHPDFKRFQRNQKYAQDLNIVYQHLKPRGCGHIFSPGDQRVLIAYLSGDLVPRSNQSNGNGAAEVAS